jgi:hypothetical protein
MFKLRSFLVWISIATVASPVFAWDATGHRLVAAIAYDRLNPNTRARVDALIKAHPDYPSWINGAPEDPAARARAAFIAAAVWADNIKGDRRFYDDTRKDSQPTPTLPGYPDMKRHTNWHYYDTPYTPDGAKPTKQAPPNALSELPRLIAKIGNEPHDRAVYDLPWIEHITGDLGQPLHCVSRILKSMPDGDAGGNRVFVNPGRNLHGLWDDAADAPDRIATDAYISKYEAEATAAHPPLPTPGPKYETNPKKWIQQGYQVARTQVYTFGLETGSRDHPIPLTADYVANAHQVAQAQIALAGYRLAAVLNTRLK